MEFDIELLPIIDNKHFEDIVERITGRRYTKYEIISVQEYLKEYGVKLSDNTGENDEK